MTLLGVEDLRALRGITVRADRSALVQLLAGRQPEPLLQHVGSALLAVGTAGLEETAHDVERRLRVRDDPGDPELADLLASRTGGAVPPGRVVRVDLDQVADLTEGDLQRDTGGWVDLVTGDCLPEADRDAMDEEHQPDDLDDPERWLWLECSGSRDRWRDRHEFAAALPPGPYRDRLLDALEGQGAFRRFARHLDAEPELVPEWRMFSAERERGRARAALAALGYVAVP